MTNSQWRAGAITIFLAASPLARIEGRCATVTSIGPEGGRIDGFAQAPSNPNRLYCLPFQRGVHRSDDRGATWSRVDTSLPPGAYPHRIAVSPVDENLVLVGDYGNRILRSTDGGITFASTTVPTGHGEPRAIAFDPTNPSVALVATLWPSPGGIWRSTDAGATWTNSNSGLPSGGVHSVAFHPTSAGIALAGTATGFARTSDGAPLGSHFRQAGRREFARFPSARIPRRAFGPLRSRKA